MCGTFTPRPILYGLTKSQCVETQQLCSAFACKNASLDGKPTALPLEGETPACAMVVVKMTPGGTKQRKLHSLILPPPIHDTPSSRLCAPRTDARNEAYHGAGVQRHGGRAGRGELNGAGDQAADRRRSAGVEGGEGLPLVRTD